MGFVEHAHLKKSDALQSARHYERMDLTNDTHASHERADAVARLIAQQRELRNDNRVIRPDIPQEGPIMTAIPWEDPGEEGKNHLARTTRHKVCATIDREFVITPAGVAQTMGGAWIDNRNAWHTLLTEREIRRLPDSQLHTVLDGLEQKTQLAS